MTDAVHTAPVRRSWGGMIWGQYRRAWSNLLALVVIAMLVGSAIYAPLIASSQPLLWCTDQGCSSPWLSGLFFNRNLFDSGIDLFFNLLIFAVPAAFLGRFALHRLSGDREAKARRQRRWLLSVSGVTLVAFFGLLFWDVRHAVPEYRALADSASVAWFTPLRMHYSDVLFGQTGTGLTHVLGLDTSGRDVFVRLLFGTRVSLAVGVIAVAIYMSIGVVVGSIAGYFGGWTDILTERTVEIFLCFPTFFLILTFISFLDQPSIVWVMVFIGVVGWTGPARLVRGEFLRLRSSDFVAAAQALGLSNRRIIFGHMLPNALSPVLVNATFGIANAVIVESTLSFLGIGDRVLPSWGRILALGRATGDNGMMLIAGLLIFITVSSLNMAGEGLRDALDPRLRQ